MNKRVKQLVALATVAVMLTGCGQKSAADIAKEAEEERGKLKTDFSVNLDNIKSEAIQAGVSVHDPSILQVDDTYYIYGSHMSAAKSKDLRRWEYVSTIDEGPANSYSEINPVYGKIYESEDGALRFTGSDDSIIPTDAEGGTRIWAPDVKYSEKAGLYYMYFCTTSSFNASTVCYATSKSPDGPFEWKGNVVYSGLTVDNYKETDVLDYVDEDYVEKHYLTAGGTYNYKEYPNALDPTIFWDKDGRMWMVYGSWSGGIYLLEIDESTGKAIHPKADNGDADLDPYYGKHLLGGGHTSIEAPYILYDKSSDYYYLYISNGGLTRTGGYQVRVYRSKTVDGDYVDMNGKKPERGSGNPAYFGIKMSGNYMLPSLPQAYMATGHNS
ncbi:MAG: family 43 glycosylhydrolase, partial [Clostridiales bacterium]|nr:family 43 glycosylhydrolase [Clostridiales bacterium]